jgi:hypothetical protein
MAYDETKDTLLPSSLPNLDTLMEQHWAQAENTGPQFLQELIETLFENMPIQLRNTPHRSTSFFLNGEPFGLSKPFSASQHLRRIIVLVTLTSSAPRAPSHHFTLLRHKM